MAMKYRDEEISEIRNDEGKIEESKGEHKKTITVHVKKKTIILSIVCALIVVIATSVAISQTRKIDGTWVRVVDDNDLTGMVVQVSNGQGTIIKAPSNNSRGYGFKDGQIKWANITKNGWGKYSFYDAISDDNSSKVYFDNSISKMEVSIDGKRLTLTVEASDLAGRTGLYQEWEKQ